MIHRGLWDDGRAGHSLGTAVPGESLQTGSVRRRALDDHGHDVGNAPTAPQALAGGVAVSVADSAALRSIMERLLGWSDDRGVELAIRSLETAIAYRAAFVLCGDGDLVPIA